MGNSSSRIFLENSSNYNPSKALCKFETDFLLVYSHNFFEFLRKNSDKKIKIFTFVGQSGAGKSAIQNMILHDFKGSLKQIFKSNDSKFRVTLGIDYYAFESVQNKGTLIVFLDCQGFQGNSQVIGVDYQEQIKKEKVEEIKITQLISLICGLSTCVIYVTTEYNKEEQCLHKLINYVKCYNQAGKCGEISNFIKILNKYDGKTTNLSQDGQIKFQKEFILKKFQSNHTSNNSYLDVPDSYKDTIKEILNYIEQTNYSSNMEWANSFKSDQTCKSVLNMIQNAFDIINQGFEKSPKNCLDIVALQQKKKNEFSQNLKEQQILLFFFNHLKGGVTNQQQKNISQPDNIHLYQYALKLYSEYKGDQKINFNDIFKIKFKNCKKNSSNIYKLKNNELIVLDEDLKKSIESFGMPHCKNLISALIVLRNIDSFFIFEIIRQMHFKESCDYENNKSHEKFLKENDSSIKSS